MRWPSKYGHSDGDIRHRTAFLFWPMCVSNQWRWLEVATWAERYIDDEETLTPGYWYKTQWIDKGENLKKQH